MDAREETAQMGRICDIALDIARMPRSPRRYNTWIAITDLCLHRQMCRHRPIYAQDLYQALNMLRSNIVQAEYDIDANTIYLRAPMEENNVING